jgi:hypothetical protein
LAKWEVGQHKLGYSELHNYFESHPALNGIGESLTGLGPLKGEYSTLSKAVHGSAKIFRMTQNLTDIRLWGDDPASVGKWATRERTVIGNLNLLLAHMFRDQLIGAGHRNLREVMGLVVPKASRIHLKSALGITVIT